MAAPEPGAKVAKDLGIYLGQIYAYIKKGTVTNHKVGGFPEGKGVEVDPDEVKAAMSSSRRRGGKGGGKPKSSARVSRGDSVASEAAREAAKEAKRMKTGSLVSYDKGLDPASGKSKGFAIRAVVGGTSKLTYLSDANRYHIFSTATLRENVAKGIAHLERPEGILSLVIFNWIVAERVDLAASLEAWMEKAGLLVSIPDPIYEDEDAHASVSEEAEEEEDDDD